jgi:hypothetical protein
MVEGGTKTSSNHVENTPPTIPIRTLVFLIQERKGLNFGMGDVIRLKR